MHEKKNKALFYLAILLIIVLVGIVIKYHKDIFPQKIIISESSEIMAWPEPGTMDEQPVENNTSSSLDECKEGSVIELPDSLCVIMYQRKACHAICDSTGDYESPRPIGRAAKGMIIGKCFVFVEDNTNYSVDCGKIKKLPAKIMTDDPTNTYLWDKKSTEPYLCANLKEMLAVWTDLERYPEQLEKEYELLMSSGILILENQTPSDNKRVLDEYKIKRQQIVAKVKTLL